MIDPTLSAELCAGRVLEIGPGHALQLPGCCETNQTASSATEPGNSVMGQVSRSEDDHFGGHRV